MRHCTVNRICDAVRQTGFYVHCYLRHGHLEKIYENALAHRLRKAGWKAGPQHPLDVFDEDGTLLGHFAAEPLAEDRVIVKLKACRAVVDGHVAQLIGYLCASRVETGLLLNFGAPKFYVKKYLFTEGAPPNDPPAL